MAITDNTLKQNALPNEGALSTANMLLTMLEALKPQLTNDDLNWLKQSGEVASLKASYWKDILEGVGCHVAGDKDVGLFQDNASLCRLLFEASNAFEELDALIQIQGECDYLLSREKSARLLTKADIRKAI